MFPVQYNNPFSGLQEMKTMCNTECRFLPQKPFPYMGFSPNCTFPKLQCLHPNWGHRTHGVCKWNCCSRHHPWTPGVHWLFFYFMNAQEAALHWVRPWIHLAQYCQHNEQLQLGAVPDQHFPVPYLEMLSRRCCQWLNRASSACKGALLLGDVPLPYIYLLHLCATPHCYLQQHLERFPPPQEWL